MSTRRWWIIGAAAGVVVVGAGAWIWLASNRVPTAEQTVVEYLRALESGDPTAVAASGVPASPAALEAFAAADAHAEDTAVDAIDGGEAGPAEGASATAEVSFRLGGENHTAQLSLTSVDGRWIVDDSGLGALTSAPTIGTFVDVGGQTVDAREPMKLLPAVYTVTAAPEDLLDGTGSAVVLPGAETDLALEAAIRPEATAAAQDQLDQHLATCAGSTDAAPPAGCGISIPWGTEFRAVTEIHYRIEKSPTITLSPTTFDATAGALVATVTGIGQDGAERSTTYRTDVWTVRGDVAFTAEELELTAW